MVVENSGLLTVAALNHLNVKGKKIVSTLSGGNMDIITMSSMVPVGLIQRVGFSPYHPCFRTSPERWSRSPRLIADENGNIVKLDHNQFIGTNRNEGVELRITIEAFGTEHKNRIVKKLDEAGFRPRLVKINL